MIKISKEILITEYIKKRKSTLYIAKKYHFNSSSVWYALRRYNIKTRTLSESLLNHKISEETKNKISKTQKRRLKKNGTYNKGKTFEQLYGKKKAKYLKENLKNKTRKRLKNRKNHWNWKGGKPKCVDCGQQLISYDNKRCYNCYLRNCIKQRELTNYKYPFQFNRQLKLKIRTRDKFKCQYCGLHERKLTGFYKHLSIHHIDYNKQNCKENNLITLCAICNTLANFNRDYWYAYYKYLLNIK